jgi:hypothetical protein
VLRSTEHTKNLLFKSPPPETGRMQAKNQEQHPGAASKKRRWVLARENPIDHLSGNAGRMEKVPGGRIELPT